MVRSREISHAVNVLGTTMRVDEEILFMGQHYVKAQPLAPTRGILGWLDHSRRIAECLHATNSRRKSISRRAKASSQ